MFSYLQESAGELAQHPERAVDVLLNEVLERVDQQLILVLDDYHHLGTETSVHAVLERLLAYLPDVLHLILISREMPVALARLRGHSLRSRSSIARICSSPMRKPNTSSGRSSTWNSPHCSLPNTESALTGGSPPCSLSVKSPIAQSPALATRSRHRLIWLTCCRQSERDIFDYFAEEVFADETEEVQQLLLKISLLNQIDLDTCGSLYPGMNCSRALPSLVRRNVFITVASDSSGEGYRLHPLFQSFLRRRLRSEIGRGGVAAEHQRYAEYFLSRQAWEQAVRQLVAAEEFDRAATVIAERGAELISSGALGSLAALADALPPSALEAHPRSLALRAEVARLRGEYEAAQAMFRRAATLLQQLDDKEGEAETLHSLATLRKATGRLRVGLYPFGSGHRPYRSEFGGEN